MAYKKKWYRKNAYAHFYIHWWCVYFSMKQHQQKIIFLCQDTKHLVSKNENTSFFINLLNRLSRNILDYIQKSGKKFWQVRTFKVISTKKKKKRKKTSRTLNANNKHWNILTSKNQLLDRILAARDAYIHAQWPRIYVDHMSARGREREREREM